MPSRTYVDRLRAAMMRAVVELQGTTAEGGDAQAVLQSALNAKREMRDEFLVVHAPGWPGGIKPHPPTWDNARRFVKENGGELRHRQVTEWVTVDAQR